MFGSLDDIGLRAAATPDDLGLAQGVEGILAVVGEESELHVRELDVRLTAQRGEDQGDDEDDQEDRKDDREHHDHRAEHENGQDRVEKAVADAVCPTPHNDLPLSTS
ncbi:hypothetical protein GCM10028787_02910 [Brachybacterium horti]